MSGAEGLDSFMAEAVVMKLRVLAESGRTIVATIHQPSSQVLPLLRWYLALRVILNIVYLGALTDVPIRPCARWVPRFGSLNAL